MTEIKVVTVGTQGLQGAQGERGPEGHGVSGPPGPRGEKGDKGDQGNVGRVDPGTRNTLPIYIDTTTLGDSVIHQYRDIANSRTYVGINNTLPQTSLHITHVGLNSDTIVRLSDTDVIGGDRQMDISACSLQTYEDAGLTVGSFTINPDGGSVIVGADLRLGIGTYEVSGQIAKLFRTDVDGFVLTAQTGSVNNLVITSPDKTTLICNPTLTNNLSLVPTTGKVIIGTPTISIGNYATLEVMGTIHASTKIVTAQSTLDNGSIVTAGDAQSTEYVCRILTTDATTSELFIDGTALRIPLPNNSSVVYSVHLVARKTDGSDSMTATYEGGIDILSGTATQRAAEGTVLYQSNLSWDFAVNPFLTGGNNYLQLSAVGVAATTIHWVAFVRVTSVG